MLIKEYHIPLPLTLEEYRIAQLYMIQNNMVTKKANDLIKMYPVSQWSLSFFRFDCYFQLVDCLKKFYKTFLINYHPQEKKSREESEGEGSSIEILENHPYTDGPNGSGQYTHKVYHIGRHLPSWFRGIAPKSALQVHEESWNAYPYTKTIFKVPFVEKFSLEVETYFMQDGGTQENLFKLSPSELRGRELDVIDIVNNELGDKDYKKEEDPSLYSSQKTGRGPLRPDWITNPPGGVIMCAYKLIKVEFRYWGLQSKVERFIHDYGLRRMMLRAHRQAWAWQDEWVGLTIPDIRRLERETQFILQKKLGRLPLDAVFKDEEEVNETGVKDGQSLKDSSLDQTDSVSNTMADDKMPSESIRHNQLTSRGSQDSERSKDTGQRSRSHSMRSRRSSKIRHARKHSDISMRSNGRLGSFERTDSGTQNKGLVDRLPSTQEYDSDNDSMHSTRPEWAFDQIAMFSDDSDAEFFDAKETISDTSDEDEPSSDEKSNEQHSHTPLSQDRPTNLRGLDDKTGSTLSVNAIPVSELEKGQRAPQLRVTGKARSLDHPVEDIGTPYVAETSNVKSSTTVDILFLVFHGGPPLDSRRDSISKNIDFQTLSDNFNTIIGLHFPAAVGRVALRMVPCVHVCIPALEMLSQIHPIPTPFSSKESHPSHQDAPKSSTDTESVQEYPTHLPVGAVPLLATDHHSYTDSLSAVTATANKVYQQFLNSKEGEHFTGQVCLLADSMGSLLAYDILNSNHPSRSSSPSPDRPPPTHHSTHSPHRSPSPERRRKYSDEKEGVSRPLSVSSLSSSTTSINIRDTEGSGFMFEVTHFFAFGSPLGLVLGSRRAKCKREAMDPPPCPSCTSFYNLFYDMDPMASRVEPLLDPRLGHVSPVSIPPYRLYPTGMAKTRSLAETVMKHPELFASQTLFPPQKEGSGPNWNESFSSERLLTNRISGKDSKPFSSWWTQTSEATRIDYLLESPLQSCDYSQLPETASLHIIHSRYWEAKELVSFAIKQVFHHHDTVSLKQTADGKELIPFLPQEQTNRWKRRTTAMKIKRLSPNHRVSDVLAVESGALPSFTAKFQYGPLAMTSLCKEEAEVHILLQSPDPRWELFGSGQTDKHGKLLFKLPEDRPLPVGVYPVKFLVKGDHTTASCNLFILPPHTEVAVFSVDGALASNFSLSAKDMKVRHGAVETARHWQERGYLLIYITGRPLIQKEHILSFLGAHRFPLGLVACADTLSPTDSQSFKTMYLARLIKEAKLIIHVAYGSQRHLAGFKDLGLQPDQIFIHGSKRTSRSSHCCQYLLDGFTSHLLTLNPRSASYDVRKLTGDICFILPGVSKGSQIKKRSSKKSSGKLEPLGSDREHRVKRLSMSLESSKISILTPAENTV